LVDNNNNNAKDIWGSGGALWHMHEKCIQFKCSCRERERKISTHFNGADKAEKLRSV
jgi:hypothetical protein